VKASQKFEIGDKVVHDIYGFGEVVKRPKGVRSTGKAIDGYICHSSKHGTRYVNPEACKRAHPNQIG
jgi:hypothetical protein